MGTFNIDDSAKLMIPTRLDAKLSNTYVDGSNIVIETKAQYLLRVTESIRVPGVEVVMLMPKSGYTSLGSYPLEDYGSILTNFDIVNYTFKGGIGDSNFVTVNKEFTYVAYASDSIGTGFTLTNNPSLGYTAILTSPVEIPSPTAGHFTGLWRLTTYSLPVATAFTLGGIKVGSGLAVSGDGTLSINISFEPPIASGSASQYYRGDKTWQTLNTSAVPEGTNSYFTNSRARAAVSLTTVGTSGAATYNPSTGVLNIPNYSSTGGIGLNSLSAVTPLAYNETNGVFSIQQAGPVQSGYLSSTDWNTFNNKVSFPGFGTTHSTAAYGDHTHSQYITGTYVKTFNTRSGDVVLSKADVESVLTGSITSHTHPVSGGTVTSVGMSVPTGLSVSPSTITTSGTFNITLTSGYSIPTTVSQNNWNTAFSWGNHAGLYDKYTSWSLSAGGVTASILGTTAVLGYQGIEFIAGSNIQITSASNTHSQLSLTISSTGGAGTVTSVGLALPTTVFSITGSPVTTSGTLTASLKSQEANRFLASPSTGSGTPSFRVIAFSDLPTGTTSTTVAVGNHTHNYQPLDSDLTAIANLTVTGGYAYRSAAGVWSIQTPSAGSGFQLQSPGTSFNVDDGGYLNINTVIGGNIIIESLPTYKRINISSPNSVQSSDITKVKTMTVLTQAAYNALTTKVATTLYIIVG